MQSAVTVESPAANMKRVRSLPLPAGCLILWFKRVWAPALPDFHLYAVLYCAGESM